MNIKRNKLKELLLSLEPAVKKSDTLQILKTILISNKYAISFDGNLGCYIQTDLFEHLENNICIPFMKLNTFVNGISTEELIFNFKDNLIIKSGKSIAEIAYEDTNDFPDFSELIDTIFDNEITVTDELSDGLKNCLAFASKNSKDGLLCGVELKGNKIISSDRQRISIFTIDKTFDKTVIIRPEIIKAIKGSDYIFINESTVAIGKNDVIYFAPLIKGTYPDAEKYLPVVKKFIKIPVDEIRIALKKVGDFSEEGSLSAKCILNLKDGIEITYEGQTAKIKDFFDFGGTLPKKKFKVNPYHLEKILATCQRFSFVEQNDVRMFYGSSDNSKFKCIMALTECN